MTIMIQREGLHFDAPMESDSRPLNTPVLALLETFPETIKLLRDPTRGGVGTVLNEIATQVKCGIDLEDHAIPIDETVASACEVLGIDPLYVTDEGVFIAVVAQEVAAVVIQLLSSFSESSRAAVIGQVTHEHPQKVVMTSGLGGRRVVNMLAGEQLPRIC